MVTFCVEDTITDILTVTLVDAFGLNSAWVLTDTALNILQISDSNVIDFTGLGDGNCLIWHLSFEEGLEGAAVGANASGLSGCFSLSNSIAVTRTAICEEMPVCEVDGGQITLADSSSAVTICVDDDIEEPITVTLANASGDNSAWVVTDTALNIIEIDTNNTFVFDNAGVGVCLIWHVSHDGTITGAEVGANAGALGGCFDLSNSVEVIREGGCGGSTCEDATSTTDLTLCEGETIVIGGIEINTAGTYIDTIMKADGCDSISITNLEVLALTTSTVEESACAGTVFTFEGVDYDVPGSYSITVPERQLHLSV